MSTNFGESSSHNRGDVSAGESKKPWYRRPSRVIPAALVAIVFISVMSGGDESSQTPDTSTPTAASWPQEDSVPAAEESSNNSYETPASEPLGTVSQQNAVDKAKSYLSLSGFSRTGLIGQLEYEGFSKEDATYAVDSLSVDWDEQAARKAQSYMETSSFSRSGLVDQLVFEGFSTSQANYGASAVGL